MQQEIRLSTWDLAGQEVYYATHQCFLSRNTLYLAVWNMEKGEDGIENLRPWLLNIQVKYCDFISTSLLGLKRRVVFSIRVLFSDNY